MNTPVCVWNLAAELGEGPVWHQDRLYFVDIKGCRIHALNPLSGETFGWDAPEPVGFVLPTEQGDFVAGLKSGLHRFDPATGRFSGLIAFEPAEIGNRCNDGAVDREGRLWFGSMHDAETASTGALYRLDSDGTCRQLDSGYVVTNGPAFSPDGRTLYHTDSQRQTIYAFDLDSAGAISGKRVFARIAEPGVYPDGPVVDSDGYLWSGLFGGWAVRRYAPNGVQVSEIPLPCSRVTKIAFGGPSLKTIFITTAWLGLSARERAREPLAGGLFKIESDVTGQPPMAIQHGVSASTFFAFAGQG